MTATRATTAPPERFNFAQHLIALNAGRAEKAAYVDDHGNLSYGALADRVRCCAAALTALGVRREERVLLLMQDCNDWPVAFLGALYAGITPVAVNTLLTPDDYAYMLAHSRAQVAMVSAALNRRVGWVICCGVGSSPAAGTIESRSPCMMSIGVGRARAQARSV